MNRLHPFTAVMNALGYAVQIGGLLFFLVAMLSGVVAFVDSLWTVVVFPLGLLIGAAYGVAYYYRFEYELAADTFDINSGVIARRSREIPFRRVQNVDISQGIVQRMLGLAVVQIETAGGGDTEARLRYVSEEEASRLQREIRRLTAAQQGERTSEGETDPSPEDADAAEPSRAAADAEADSTDADRPTAEPRTDASDGAGPGGRSPTQVFALDGKELLLLSFSSFKLSGAVLIPFVIVFAGDAIVDLLVSLAQPFGGPADLEGASTPQYGLVAATSILYGALATYLLGVAYTFATYYDFRLGSAGEDLVYERGLVQRYSGSVPVDKIQSFSITENPVQRAIGYAGLWVETAGYGPDSSGGSQSAVPLARRNRVEGFVSRATDLEAPSFERPPTLARRRYVARYSMIAAVIVVAAFAADAVWGIPYWYASAVAFLAAPVGAHLRWTNLGYVVCDDHLLVREGFWRRRTHVVPYYRIQTVSTRRSYFQRRLGLASFVVDTASSRTFAWATPTIHDLSLETSREIHEESRDRLEAARRERTDDGSGVSVAFT